MNEKLTAQLVLGFAAAFALVSLGWWLKPCPCAEVKAASATVKIDTLWKVIKSEPILLKSKAVVVFDTITQTDTIYKTKAFTATLDTITGGGDTVKAAYRFPANTFDLAIRRRLDSVAIETRTVTLTNTVVETKLQRFGIGGHIGYGIGLLGVPQFVVSVGVNVNLLGLSL